MIEIKRMVSYLTGFFLYMIDSERGLYFFLGFLAGVAITAIIKEYYGKK